MLAANTTHCEQTLMFTDIVGYSRLMGRDEALTIEMLGDYRTILLSHIEAQGGQLVEFAGDAIFARFDTAAAAVTAAINIQKNLSSFNQGRDDTLPPLQTRIGIHKGEVLLRENAVLGDSVNIAARLEPIAVADGICVSKAVYDDIRLQLCEPVKRLGSQELKNIEQKISVFLIKPSGIKKRDHLHYLLRTINQKITAYRYPLSATLFAIIIAGVYFIPRWLVPGYAANYVEIADFKNLMDEKGDSDYFSAGITEAVRSQLADMRDVYIVNAKEGIHAPIRLEGSVQKLGDNLRIAYRLFRRKDDVQIAGGKLDGTYQDIFILQDRLVGEIARYLAEEFKLQNFRPAPLKLTNDATAYDYYLRGLDFLGQPNSHQSVDSAIQNFNTSLVHDAVFSLANTGLCEAYWKKYEITSAARWLDDAERHCLLALEQDNTSVRTYKAIGSIYRDTGKYHKAIKYFQKGLFINEEDVATVVALASAYDLSNMNKEAEALYISIIKRYPKNWMTYDGYGYYLTRHSRYDEAISNYYKVLNLTTENITALNNIGINYLLKNDFAKAASAFEKAAEIEPNTSIFANTGNMYYFSKDFSKAARMFEKALRLEPHNFQWLVFCGDAYKFIKSKNKITKEYFNRAVEATMAEIRSNPTIAKNYQYAARSLAYLGRLEEAQEMLYIANQLDSDSTESIYTNLRIAILENNEDKIRKLASRLLETEYSDKLLLADPDFSILHEPQYQDIFAKPL